jgi:hypothetical protein
VNLIRGLLNRSKIVDSDIVDHYHTIFGFTTSSKVAAISIDIVYWFIIFVAYCFAFHALAAILITWHWTLIALASFAVVGLPYCVKIILFGRKEFPLKAALLSVFLSLIPTIFDFAGLYSETGVQDSLKSSKDQITEVLSYFEAESKKATQIQELEIRNNNRDKKAEIEKSLITKTTETKKQIEDINQEIIDEKQGIRGKAGDGPKSKELQANMRKLQAQANIEQQSVKTEFKQQIEAIDLELADQLKSLNKSTLLLDNKIITCKKEINASITFRELESTVINANSLISSIASNLDIKFTPVKISGTDNIIKVSFTSLLNCDVTAVVCFLLAFLMEIGDIIIAFTIRYEKKTEPQIIDHDNVDDYRKATKYTKTYDGY